MEKCFIVRDEELINHYNSWKSEQSRVDESFNKLCDEFEIETRRYYPFTKFLKIEPTVNDIKRFKSCFLQSEQGKFRKNSSQNKRWLQILKEQSITGIMKPYLPNYVNGNSTTYKTNIFKINDIVYCRIQTNCDFDSPKEFEEIRCSEYHSVIEEYNSKLSKIEV